MRPLCALLGAALLLTACSDDPTPTAVPPAPAAVSPSAAAAAVQLLALGDSVAAGVGADVPGTGGYVPLLAERLRGRGADVALRPLAVSGATTATVLRDQVPQAVRLLQEDADGARLVTLTVGGNDVFGPVLLSCVGDPASPGCRAAVADALAAADRGVDQVLDALDAAAPDGPVLAVMTYYDPLPSCRLAALSPLAQQVLEGSGGGRGLNDVLRARAAEHDAVVVETAERVSGPADLVGGGDCLHPSGQGHAEIAAAFDEAVGARVTQES